MQFAVIDCGTNVFNLLVAEADNGILKISSSYKISVQLFKGSQNTNFIPEHRQIRGIDAIHSFLSTLRSLEIQKIHCVATSAIRESSNGSDFVRRVNEKLGLEINIISGDEEAKLIYYGVQYSGMLDERMTLLIDIGGGSVEFTLCNNQEIIRTLSLPIGVSRLKEILQHAETLGNSELNALRQHLKEMTQPLKTMVAGVKIDRCIGTSGSFDTLFNIYKSSIKDDDINAIINYDIFEQIHQWLIRLSLEERLKDNRILPERAEYLPYATALISYILELTGPLNFEHCKYNLKEGLASRFAMDLGLIPQKIA